jgi:hypothetical protein
MEISISSPTCLAFLNLQVEKDDVGGHVGLPIRLRFRTAINKPPSPCKKS